MSGLTVGGKEMTDHSHIVQHLRLLSDGNYKVLEPKRIRGLDTAFSPVCGAKLRQHFDVDPTVDLAVFLSDEPPPYAHKEVSFSDKPHHVVVDGVEHRLPIPTFAVLSDSVAGPKFYVGVFPADRGCNECHGVEEAGE